MLSWENAPSRPLPEICIDCGPEFGTIVRPVIGTFAKPSVEDPEPALIAREEQRRRDLEREEENRRRRQEEYERFQDNMMREEESNREAEQKVFKFVDVDEVTVEKVDVSFDKVEDMPPPPKKKRRKKL